jgi:hypothetical protein
MKRLFCILPLIYLISCSPKLPPVETKVYAPLPDTAFVVVLEEDDRYSNNHRIGIINSVEHDLSYPCTYEKIIEQIKQIARSRGANLVKITDYKKPDRENNCDRISARIYKVDNAKLYERKFSWSPARKLSWEDYKGNPATIREANVGARTSCRLGIRVDTIRTAGTAHVVVTNEFICHQSSVRTEQMKPALLAHEQLHFDLCEVYARQLRKELAEAHFTPANVTPVSREIFLRLYKMYRDQQELYDTETNHGLNIQAQDIWKRKIEEALAALAAYPG